MATEIMVDGENVVIPLEVLNTQNDGLTVLTLARGAYLIMRSDLLASYPRQRLLEFSQMARALEETPGSQQDRRFTSRKQQALRELGQQGYPISDGLEYGLQAMSRPEIELAQVRRGLSTMAGSLAQEVLAERDER